MVQIDEIKIDLDLIQQDIAIIKGEDDLDDLKLEEIAKRQERIESKLDQLILQK